MVFRALIVLFHGYNIEIYKIIKATLLTLHFLSYAKFFCRSKGGHGLSGPMVNTLVGGRLESSRIILQTRYTQ